MTHSGGTRGRSPLWSEFFAEGEDLNIHSQVTPRPIRREVPLEHAYRLAADALAQGGVRTSRGSVTWDLSGNCAAGVHTEVYARPSSGKIGRGRDLVVIRPKEGHPMFVDIVTRCRKCDQCRRHKARLWRARATAEWHCAARTWFGTLTANPTAQYIWAARARARVGMPTWDGMPEERQFAETASEAGRDITLWLKRIRKESGARLRYLLVVEAHRSGLPHFHMLLHEVRADKPVTKATMESQWKHGFSSWRLVTDPRAATYVCKYLTKTDGHSRVRASQFYGKGTTISDHSFNPLKRVENTTPTNDKPNTLE